MKERLIKVYRKIYRSKVLRPVAFLIYYVGLTRWFNDFIDWVDVHIFHNDFQKEKLYYQNNKMRVVDNIKVLADEKSKYVYKGLINYRRTHNRKYMRGIVDSAKDMYFDCDIVKWKQDEGFCECGAYNGDTLHVISKLMLKNKVNRWWAIAFECEDRNFKLLERRINNEDLLRNRVIPYKMATWSEKATLHFDSGMEQSSRLSDNGIMTVNADSIDNIIDSLKKQECVNVDCKSLLTTKGEISFVIMDVEGAEMPSIKGAYNTISEYHPRLAISIYHSDSDMVDIIEYIHSNWPFYKLYVRHYTWLYTETILYAIP